MESQPLTTQPTAPRPQCDGMFLPTSVVRGTVANLLPLYGEDARAVSLSVERFPAKGAKEAYGTSILCLKDGRLVTSMPKSVLSQIVSTRKGWGMANRFHELVTGGQYFLNDILSCFPPRLEVTHEFARPGTYWTGERGQAHHELAKLDPELQLEVWDPTEGKFVPAFVREAISRNWAPGQHGQGAILELPVGIAERMQALVDGLLREAKRGLAAELREFLMEG